MSQITLKTAEKNWTDILQRVLRGEETIIEQNGRPVAKVSPVKTEEDWFGMDEGKISIADDFNETPKDFLGVLNGVKKK